MSDHSFDCAIIGGGLAGLSLSILLAQKGFNVALFEKECYPYNKVCGEYISMESYAFIERLGYPLRDFNLPSINRLLVSSPKGTSIEADLDLGGFGIRRFTLDSELATIAKSNGVKLFEQTKVLAVENKSNLYIVDTATESYNAALVFGTFGRRSILDRQLNRLTSKNSTNYIGVKYHIKTDHPHNQISLHNFKGGYCGISKVDQDLYCLCYLADSKILKDSENNIQKMEEKYLKRNPFLKDYFENSNFFNAKPLVISQVTFSKRSTSSDGIIYVGDAAGSIAPCFGNGMSMALRSSFILAELIDHRKYNVEEKNDLLREYDKNWNQHFSKRINTGLAVQRFMGNDTLTNPLIRVLKHFPKAVDWIVKQSHGEPF